MVLLRLHHVQYGEVIVQAHGTNIPTREVVAQALRGFEVVRRLRGSAGAFGGSSRQALAGFHELVALACERWKTSVVETEVLVRKIDEIVGHLSNLPVPPHQEDQALLQLLTEVRSLLMPAPPAPHADDAASALSLASTCSPRSNASLSSSTSNSSSSTGGANVTLRWANKELPLDGELFAGLGAIITKNHEKTVLNCKLSGPVASGNDQGRGEATRSSSSIVSEKEMAQEQHHPSIIKQHLLVNHRKRHVAFADDFIELKRTRREGVSALATLSTVASSARAVEIAASSSSHGSIRNGGLVGQQANLPAASAEEDNDEREAERERWLSGLQWNGLDADRELHAHLRSHPHLVDRVIEVLKCEREEDRRALLEKLMRVDAGLLGLVNRMLVDVGAAVPDEEGGGGGGVVLR